MPAIVLVMGKKEGCNKMSKKTHFVTAPFAVGARTWRARSRKWLITGFLYIPAGAPRRRPYNTIHGIPTSGPWAASQTAFGGQLPY